MSQFIKNIIGHKESDSNRVETITITFIGDEVKFEDASKLDKKILYNILSNKKRQELTNLDYSINNLRMTYNSLKSENDKKLKETEDRLKAKYECSICMENTREYACIPCGHTYCEECCRKMTNGQCYTCRKQVNFFQKLF